MKNTLLLSVCFLILAHSGFAQKTQSKESKAIENLLATFKKEHAPDGRTVYFQPVQNEDNSFTVETSSTKLSSFLQENEKKTGKLPITIKTLPEESLKDQVFGVINLSVANLRTRPTHSAELATQALLGTPVDVLKKSGGFYLIRTPDHYLSWVDRYGVSLMNKSDYDAWKSSKRLIYTNDFGYAYEESNEKSARVSDVILGDILKSGSLQGEFQEVYFPDGRKAFVKANQLEDLASWKNRTTPNADGIIETAKTMLGIPYLWGGTSVKGVDCSGFTKTAFFMNGLVLPRDASQQITNGLPIDIMSNGDIDVEKAKKNLKKGDLIFFSGSKTTNPRQPITHVAIYMDNGEFIHAAGRVRINSFDLSASNYDSQSETIVSAQRYLGGVGSTPVPSIGSLDLY